MSDLIDRQAAIDAVNEWFKLYAINRTMSNVTSIQDVLRQLPSAQPEIIRCEDCAHNPKETWFECPMAHLSEKQRPETAWCWKAERRTDE